MAERLIGRGIGQGIFGQVNTVYVATLAAAILVEEVHTDLTFQLPPEFEVSIEYNERNGEMGITGVIIRFAEIVL